MNITDVGHMTDEASPEAVDKMLLAVEDEGLSPLEIAEKYTRGGPRRRRPRSGSAPADVYPKATEHIPEMIALTRDADRPGPRLRRRHRAASTTTSRSFPGYGQALGQHARQAARGPPRPRDRPAQAPPRRLRPVEGGRPGPADEVASPVGRGLPRVAHRVLGDVDEVPGRAHRHPHRRHRPALPAPRGRDRAVRGRGRASGRLDLGARRATCA